MVMTPGHDHDDDDGPGAGPSRSPRPSSRNGLAAHVSGDRLLALFLFGTSVDSQPKGRITNGKCGESFQQVNDLRTAAVNAASGSAYAEFGNTKMTRMRLENKLIGCSPAGAGASSVDPSGCPGARICLLRQFRFGPRESKKAMMYSDIGRLNCNVSYTTFATQTRSQGSDHKEFSSMLHKALEGAIILESFPKTTVDVFALVLESGGSDLPVIISCASVALADSGIMMFDLVSSVSVVCAYRCHYSESGQHNLRILTTMNNFSKLYGGAYGLPIEPTTATQLIVHSTFHSCLGKNLVIDPTLEEENFQDGSLMIACMPSRNEVTQLTLTGEWSTPKIHEAMELCLDACLKLGNIMRSCLKEAAAASQ
ncbi:hypothetical protein ACLOJK_009562 [Asimina triloba]